MTKKSMLVALLIIIILLVACTTSVETGPSKVPHNDGAGGVTFGMLCDTVHHVGMWTATRRVDRGGYGFAVRMTDEEYSQHCGR